MISAQIQTAAYLFASILFILSLGGLSSQESAKRGVLYGIIGMVIAIAATVAGAGVNGHIYILAGIAIASVIGIMVARRVEMTAMPQLVAILHSFVGLAAVLVGFGSYIDPHTQDLAGTERNIHLVEVFIGTFIGAITFTGSIIAWGKTGRKDQKQASDLSGSSCRQYFIGSGLHRLRRLFRTGSRGIRNVIPLHHDSHCFLYWCHAGHGYRRSRHAGGRFHAQLLFGMGSSGSRIYAGQ